MQRNTVLSLACAAVLGGVAALASAPALGQTADLVQQAYALQAAGDARAAYALLRAQEAERAGDPAFDYALGVAALDAGQTGEAVIALQRVLAVNPQDARARAELARAYAATGDMDTAKAQFDQVSRDPTLPDPVRQQFENLVEAYDRQINGGSSVQGFVEAVVGHDSNVNSATSLTSITLPAFAWLGAGTLSGSSRAMRDDYAEIQAGVSGVKGLGRQDRLFLSAMGFWRNNTDTRAYDQAAANITAGYAHTFANRDVLSVSAQYQDVQLGHHGFRDSIGGIVQYTHLMEGGKAISFGLHHHYLDYRASAGPDGHRTALAAAFNTKRMTVGGQFGRERTTDARLDALSYRFANVTAAGLMPLSDRFAFTYEATLDHRKHDDQDLLFLTRRKDLRLDLAAGMRWTMRPNLALVAKLGWSQNDSNIALYDYRRTWGNVGIRYEF